MTPEQVCEVLERHNVLRLDYEQWIFPYPSDNTCAAIFPEDVLEDGNVAMAAWEAVKAKVVSQGGSISIIQTDGPSICCRTIIAILKDAKNLSCPECYESAGTDTTAFTTACAMALAEDKQ